MYDIIGFVGTFTILLAYFFVQTGRLLSQNMAYSLLNLGGACALVFSLIGNFNLPVLILESVWILISLYGVYAAAKRVQ